MVSFQCLKSVVNAAKNAHLEIEEALHTFAQKKEATSQGVSSLLISSRASDKIWRKVDVVEIIINEPIMREVKNGKMKH